MFRTYEDLLRNLNSFLYDCDNILILLIFINLIEKACKTAHTESKELNARALHVIILLDSSPDSYRYTSHWKYLLHKCVVLNAKFTNISAA